MAFLRVLWFPPIWNVDRVCSCAPCRGVGTGGGGGKGDTCPSPNLFKVPFFVMKSTVFVQANVAVNTILTSKVSFL